MSRQTIDDWASIPSPSSIGTSTEDSITSSTTATTTITSSAAGHSFVLRNIYGATEATVHQTRAVMRRCSPANTVGTALGLLPPQHPQQAPVSVFLVKDWRDDKANRARHTAAMGTLLKDLEQALANRFDEASA